VAGSVDRAGDDLWTVDPNLWTTYISVTTRCRGRRYARDLGIASLNGGVSRPAPADPGARGSARSRSRSLRRPNQTVGFGAAPGVPAGPNQTVRLKAAARSPPHRTKRFGSEPHPESRPDRAEPGEAAADAAQQDRRQRDVAREQQQRDRGGRPPRPPGQQAPQDCGVLGQADRDSRRRLRRGVHRQPQAAALRQVAAKRRGARERWPAVRTPLTGRS
jgi:hypothetical protein